MYYRSQGYRYPKDVRIPINYSGNAFSESSDANINEEPEQSIIELQPESESKDELSIQHESTESSKDTEEASESSNSTPAASLFNNLGKNSLFSKIGSEELLILALVFLLSDTDSDNDIIWLLLLLLFIK